MATDLYGQGVTYLDPTDKPDLNIMGKAIVDPLTQRSNMVFQNATARDAAIASPLFGMHACLVDEGLTTWYDGASWTAIAAGTQSWTTPTLATGYTANGNGNGTPRYRVVNLFGDLVVMWKGGINVTYSGGSPVGGGQFLHDTLPSAVRPDVRRTVTAACSAISSADLSVKIDFVADGTLSIVTQPGVQPPWISLNNIMYSLAN